MSNRSTVLAHWLEQQLQIPTPQLVPASSDASFRRYFRLTVAENSYIVMDAPPEQEDCRPFLAVAARLHAAGVTVPNIFASDVQHGFLLLSDFGNTLYLNALTPDNADTLYQSALNSLCRIQQADSMDLPLYDATLLNTEMALFTDWLLGEHLGLVLSDQEQKALAQCFALLIDNALSQPQVFVHRDYHSRNLMYLADSSETPGILDFQDAVRGAVTYDLVSLLRDCYITWPRDQVQHWVQAYQAQAEAAGILAPMPFTTFWQWFEWMGVQRHLKASGIFARLFHRDGKDSYLAEIPRTLGYIIAATATYPALTPLHQLVTERVLPAYLQRESNTCAP